MQFGAAFRKQLLSRPADTPPPPKDHTLHVIPGLLAIHALQNDPRLPPGFLTSKPCCKNDCVFALCTSHKYVHLCREIFSELEPLALAAACSTFGARTVHVPTKSEAREGTRTSKSEAKPVVQKRKRKLDDTTGHLRESRQEAYMSKLKPRLLQLHALCIFKNVRRRNDGKAVPPCLNALQILTSINHTQLTKRAKKHDGQSLATSIGLTNPRSSLRRFGRAVA